MRYIRYDPATGAILQYGTTLPGAGEMYIESAVGGSLADYCVLAGELTPKTLMTLGIPGPTPADGATEAAITGVPAGTRATFVLGGVPYNVPVDDGALELVASDPQVVQVRLWHPTYYHDPVEVTFT